MAVVMILNMKT